jgi:hypothetical protein
MPQTHTDIRHWKEAFEHAAREALGEKARGPDGDSYRVTARYCKRHGNGCALVVYGILLAHVAWPREDPRRLAGRLVRTMLPPAESADAAG